MRCIVTAGPTFEPLDDVRRLTNFSTGQLGSELATHLTEHHHQVTLLIGQQATWRGDRFADRVETFTTTADLRERLHALAGTRPDALFHAAAVSDFVFGRIWVEDADGKRAEIKAGKLSTRGGKLLAELLPTPKVISELRGWYPQTRITGWKFEVDGDRAAAIARAQAQISECGVDACVVNGPAYGPGYGLVHPDGSTRHVTGSRLLLEALEYSMRSPAAAPH
jgi:phosphopantothenate---cysteine ligase (CTP)